MLLNDRLDFGKVEGFSRLKAHMLRKFHSTQFAHKSPYRKLGMDEIDLLHGMEKQCKRIIFKDTCKY